MKVDIKKTDRRHTGYGVFDYVADVQWLGIGRRSERMMFFNQVREWTWTTMGASCERDQWIELTKFNQPVPNERWCWHTDFGNYKIYLRTDKEANWFKLKWL